jgi:methionyl-tRNA formyltransferase
MKVNIFFAGVFPFSWQHLERILESNKFEISGILLSKQRKHTSLWIENKINQLGKFIIFWDQKSLLQNLTANSADQASQVLVIAGFPEKINPQVIEAFNGRVVNVHPSFLPDFAGPDPVRRAILQGIDKFGYTIHKATSEIDSGFIFKQSLVKTSTSWITERIIEEIGAISSSELVEFLEKIHLHFSIPQISKFRSSEFLGTKVADNEFNFTFKEDIQTIFRKLRAAGISRRLIFTRVDGSQSVIHPPDSMIYETRIILEIGSGPIAIRWDPGGSLSIE